MSYPKIRLILPGLLLLLAVFSMAFAGDLRPLAALALPQGRTYDQAHDTGYIDWSGPAQYVYITHRDGSSLPPEEGGTFCESGCSEWVTELDNGGTASGSFDRDVSSFQVMVGFIPDSGVGSATLRACSAVDTWNLYGGSGGLPGFVNMPLTIPAGCRSWSLSASGGYVDFRSMDVTYVVIPPTATSTVTPLPTSTPYPTSTLKPTITPTALNTATFVPTATATPSRTASPTPTFTRTATATPSPTPTNTPSPTPTASATPSPTPSPTPYPPVITGQIVCDLWGDVLWCKGNESLELTASDPQGFEVTISGNLNGVPFSCGSSCMLSLPEGTGVVSYTAVSTSGRTASGSATWMRDGTPPLLNILLPAVNGSNGWYVSELDVSANASDAISGLLSIAGSIDEGVTRNSLPLHLTDGVYSVMVPARDVAGNETTATHVFHIDTVPPISHFTSHSNWDVVGGTVTLCGKLEDATSGAASGELSLDDGTTWQAVSMGTSDTWSLAWNTDEVPNGQYTLQARGMDEAGNLGDAARVTLFIDNGSPHVSLTDRWWIWEEGQLHVSPNYFPIASVRVTISDPQNRWPALRLDFDPQKVTGAISWDRHFADGTLAPSGEYRAVAVACDVHDLCGSDSGTIAIPNVATSTTTMTPSPTATLTATPRATSTATMKPVWPTPGFITPLPEATPAPVQPVSSLALWQVLGLVGLMLALASAGLIDPRPAAVHLLSESIKLITSQNINDSSENDE